MQGLDPRDANGMPLAPFDLVIINQIPEFLYDDPEVDDETARSLLSYVGSYGLITYFGDQAHLSESAETPAWRSRDKTHVYVLAVSIKDDVISGYDMFLPTKMLTRIPANYLINSLFLDCPWHLESSDPQYQVPTVVRGTELFDNMARILRTPYPRLLEINQHVQSMLVQI